MIGRQILYAIGVFIVYFVLENIRVYFTDYVIKDRGWSFKKSWKLSFVFALIVAIAVFIYLRVTGQTQF